MPLDQFMASLRMEQELNDESWKEVDGENSDDEMLSGQNFLKNVAMKKGALSSLDDLPMPIQDDDYD